MSGKQEALKPAFAGASPSSTLFDKIWDAHRVCTLESGDDLLYIDRLLLHERTGSLALMGLLDNGHTLRQREHVLCVMDHIVDTRPGRGDQTPMPGGEQFIASARAAAHEAGLTLFDIDDPRQGIVHVVSPEQGIALPGCIVLCPDSHACTVGGIGALGWGIGSSQAEHVLATACIRVRRPRNLRAQINGRLRPEVTAKDIILHLIADCGVKAGSGYAVEFCGAAVSALSAEGRMTLCNMAVEFAAFTALIAPDEKAIKYIHGRSYAPSGAAWRQAVEYWRGLASDDDARFEREITIDAEAIRPTVTWGTSPEQATAITGMTPHLEQAPDEKTREAWRRALDYMGLRPGQALKGLAIDAAFIGSCTNSRLEDLRVAAEVLRGKRIASGMRAVCVPGSSAVKRAAEAEGINQIFEAAGFEWRESGCSMCFYSGGETFGRGARVITTTNRNFENRQGPGTRSHLASPATVAASALAGRIEAASS